MLLVLNCDFLCSAIALYLEAGGVAKVGVIVFAIIGDEIVVRFVT